MAQTKELAEQLERALWYHIPKETRTHLLTGDYRPDDLRGVTCATVASALNYVRGWLPAEPGDGRRGASRWRERAVRPNCWTSQKAPQFGVTATPWRGDRFDIRHRFGEPSYTLGIEDGMRLGYLAEVRYRLSPTTSTGTSFPKPASTVHDPGPERPVVPARSGRGDPGRAD